MFLVLWNKNKNDKNVAFVCFFIVLYSHHLAEDGKLKTYNAVTHAFLYCVNDQIHKENSDTDLTISRPIVHHCKHRLKDIIHIYHVFPTKAFHAHESKHSSASHT